MKSLIIQIILILTLVVVGRACAQECSADDSVPLEFLENLSFEFEDANGEISEEFSLLDVVEDMAAYESIVFTSEETGESWEVSSEEVSFGPSCQECEEQRLAQCDLDPRPPITPECAPCFTILGLGNGMMLDPCDLHGHANAVHCKLVVKCTVDSNGELQCSVGVECTF